MQLAYQVADTYDDPGTEAGLASARTADGYYFPSDYEDPSTNFKGHQLVRFGWLVILTNGGPATAWARVSGGVQIVTI